MPRGGARKGAGRKTKAAELGLKFEITPEVFDALISVLIELGTKKKNLRAIELILAYVLGKPKERVEHSGDQEQPITVRVEYADADS